MARTPSRVAYNEPAAGFHVSVSGDLFTKDAIKLIQAAERIQRPKVRKRARTKSRTRSRSR